MTLSDKPVGLVMEKGSQEGPADADPAGAVRFVRSIMEVVNDGANPRDVVNAEEIVSLGHPRGLYTSTIGGADAGQIPVAGNEKQARVIVAVTMDNHKLPLFTIVEGKTVRSELRQDGAH